MLATGDVVIMLAGEKFLRIRELLFSVYTQQQQRQYAVQAATCFDVVQNNKRHHALSFSAVAQLAYNAFPNGSIRRRRFAPQGCFRALLPASNCQ